MVQISTFLRICELVKRRNVRVSAHGYARLSKRGILFADVITGITQGYVIEDYPDFYLGPAVLVLQIDASGKPLHVVWGLEKGTDAPAVAVTAYYPDPSEWSSDFRSRKP